MTRQSVTHNSGAVVSDIPATINHVIQFDDAVANEINQHVHLACKIWQEALPDLSTVRFTVGNYAGYGAYRAICHKSGIIEIPMGNQFRLLKIDSNNRLVHANDDRRDLLGIVLHEIGHHVVNTSRSNPWNNGPQIATSTHLCRQWLWICATGWNYFHNLSITPAKIVASAKHDKKSWSRALRGFNPYRLPPSLTTSPEIACKQCGACFVPSRNDAKYCSAKCRVYAARQRKDSQG